VGIGERIQLGRRIVGLSQRALAEKVGVSATAISKYERNQDTPSSPVLHRLKEALDVSTEFLLRPSIVKQIGPPVCAETNCPRKSDATFGGRIQEWLERYLETEELLVSDGYGSGVGFQYPKGFPRSVGSLPEAEDAARALRDAWELGQGPIESLMELLEDRGIKVGLVDGCQGSGACRFWAQAEEAVPVITVGRNLPGDQQRLVLAMQLAFLLLRSAGAQDSALVLEGARRFARALLVPPDAARLELGEHRHTVSRYELHMLKHQYGISMESWVLRARELGILPSVAGDRLLQSMEENGGDGACEPGEAFPPERSTRLERMVMRALSEDLISERRASELLGKPFSQFAQEVAEGHDGLEVVVCGRY
jgi:transcriptional regulator with XRE-family HTH domain/Zn-dependent peptidase ImmA (M78 family)